MVKEKAESDGRPVHVTPLYFGLSETNLCWGTRASLCPGLNRVERLRQYTAIWGLHAIGIRHEDLAPRNVIRSSDGTFEIVDFAWSLPHHCQGLRSVGLSSFPADNKNKEPGCEELESMWRVLGKPGLSQRPSKRARPFKSNAKKLLVGIKVPLAN